MSVLDVHRDACECACIWGRLVRNRVDAVKMTSVSFKMNDETPKCTFVSKIMEAKTPELMPTRATRNPLESLHLGSVLLELKPKLERRPSREEVQMRGLIKNNVDVVQGTLARRSIASSLERAMRTRPSSTDLIESGVMQSEGSNTEGIWQYEMARQKWLPATSNEPAPRRLARQFGYTYGGSVHVTIRESDVPAAD